MSNDYEPPLGEFQPPDGPTQEEPLSDPMGLEKRQILQQLVLDAEAMALGDAEIARQRASHGLPLGHADYFRRAFPDRLAAAKEAVANAALVKETSVPVGWRTVEDVCTVCGQPRASCKGEAEAGPTGDYINGLNLDQPIGTGIPTDGVFHNGYYWSRMPTPEEEEKVMKALVRARVPAQLKRTVIHQPSPHVRVLPTAEQKKADRWLKVDPEPHNPKWDAFIGSDGYLSPKVDHAAMVAALEDEAQATRLRQGQRKPTLRDALAASELQEAPGTRGEATLAQMGDELVGAVAKVYGIRKEVLLGQAPQGTEEDRKAFAKHVGERPHRQRFIVECDASDFISPKHAVSQAVADYGIKEPLVWFEGENQRDPMWRPTLATPTVGKMLAASEAHGVALRNAVALAVVELEFAANLFRVQEEAHQRSDHDRQHFTRDHSGSIARRLGNAVNLIKKALS